MAVAADTSEELPTLLAARRRCQAVTADSSALKPWTWSEDHDKLEGPGVCTVRSLRVRNTFIDTSCERSPSLDKFYRDRKTCSCPTSPFKISADDEEAERKGEQPCGHALRPPPPVTTVAHSHCAATTITITNKVAPAQRAVLRLADALHVGEDVPALPGIPCGQRISTAPNQLPPTYAQQTPACAAATCTSAAAAAGPLDAYRAAAAVSAAGVPYVQSLHATPWQLPTQAMAFAVAASPVAAPTLMAAPAVPSATAPSAPRPIQLAEATAARPEDSEDLPSVGSASHSRGKCKPCAFFHTAGCGNGLSCQFCHLCDAGEKKRRKKERMDNLRCARKTRQVETAGEENEDDSSPTPSA